MSFPSPPDPPEPLTGFDLDRSAAQIEPQAREPRGAPSRSVRVWLIRHGRVAEPRGTYGNRDVELSAEGLAQTEAVALALKDAPIDSIVASPLQRARKLGEAIVRQHGSELELRLDPRLREIDRGDWQDLPVEEYDERWRAEADAYWRDPLHWRGHGGESDAQILARAWPALVDAVEAAQDGGTVVLAAHRQVIRNLVAGAMGIPAAASFAMTLDPAHGVQLACDPSGAWLLERTNVSNLAAPQAAELAGAPPADVPLGPEGAR